MNGELSSYDFIPSNNDHHSIKNHESSMLKTSTTLETGRQITKKQFYMHRSGGNSRFRLSFF